MVKFHSSPVVVDEASTAVQKIVGVPTDAVLFCQRFSAEAAVGLGLVQSHDALLAALKPGAVLTQLVLNFSLRQNKSGGLLLALRSVDVFNLLGFGRNVDIEETQL